MNDHTPAIGIFILALATALVGLLGLFLAGAELLIGRLSVQPVGLRATVVPSAVGLAYLVLAYALFTVRAWAPWLALVLLVASLLGSLLSTVRVERMDLGLLLVFMLAIATSMAVIMALFLPSNRTLFRRGG